MIPPKTKFSIQQADRTRRSSSTRSLCAGISAVILLAGCSVVPPQTAAEDTSYQAWKKLAKDSAFARPPSPVFPAMQNFHQDAHTADMSTSLKVTNPELLPQIPIRNMVLTREMDVGVLLRTLADAADLNVLISNSVSGPVHVSLRHETRWDRLFLAITEARGYHYDLQDGLLSIFSVNDVRDKVAMDQALSEQRVAAEKRMRSEPPSVDLIRVHYADIDNLADSVRSTMSAVATSAQTEGQEPESGDDGSRFSVQANRDTGQLIIHGISSDLSRARKLIQGLDQPTYQIMIEASIVQASNEIARELGVQWGVLDGSSNGEFTLGTTSNESGFNSNFPAGFSSTGNGFVFGASQVRGSQLLQAQLSALQTDGRLNIVSRPSVTTLDQLTAVIESGQERPFSSSAGAGANAVAQVEFKRAVLRLEVTPHVIDTNWVRLEINTTNDEFDDTQSVIVDGNVQVPIITRSAATSLYLANGQTTVIGGLSSETTSRQEQGVPFLKNIPGLGAMFRNRSNRDSFDDTLIFITPHILPRAGAGRKGSVDYQGK